MTHQEKIEALATRKARHATDRRDAALVGIILLLAILATMAFGGCHTIKSMRCPRNVASIR